MSQEGEMGLTVIGVYALVGRNAPHHDHPSIVPVAMDHQPQDQYIQGWHKAIRGNVMIHGLRIPEPRSDSPRVHRSVRRYLTVSERQCPTVSDSVRQCPIVQERMIVRPMYSNSHSCDSHSDSCPTFVRQTSDSSGTVRALHGALTVPTPARVLIGF